MDQKIATALLDKPSATDGHHGGSKDHACSSADLRHTRRLVTVCKA